MLRVRWRKDKDVNAKISSSITPCPWEDDWRHLPLPLDHSGQKRALVLKCTPVLFSELCALSALNRNNKFCVKKQTNKGEIAH